MVHRHIYDLFRKFSASGLVTSWARFVEVLYREGYIGYRQYEGLI